MDELNLKIRNAQILASEQSVIKDLESKGFNFESNEKINFSKLKTGTKAEKMLSKACVLMTGMFETRNMNPQDVLDLLDDLTNGRSCTTLNETVAQTIIRLNLGTEKCAHEKQKYDLATGGGKCRKCGALVGF